MLVFPRETAIKLLIMICLICFLEISLHLHNGTLLRKLPSEMRDVRGEKLQGAMQLLAMPYNEQQKGKSFLLI